MTGRDLVIYIMKNNLEDEEIFKNGIFLGCMNENEAAAKFGVGVATIRVWFQHNVLKGTKIGDSIFILKDQENPRKEI